MGTTRNGQAPNVTTQITINKPAPVQAPTIQVPYVPVEQAPIVQVPYGQAPPPPYKYLLTWSNLLRLSLFSFRKIIACL